VASCAALEGYPLRIVERVALVTAPNAENIGYLSAKQSKLGHMLGLAAKVGHAPDRISERVVSR
jgi:hypothetical protein